MNCARGCAAEYGDAGTINPVGRGGGDSSFPGYCSLGSLRLDGSPGGYELTPSIYECASFRSTVVARGHSPKVARAQGTLGRLQWSKSQVLVIAEGSRTQRVALGMEFVDVSVNAPQS